MIERLLDHDLVGFPKLLFVESSRVDFDDAGERPDFLQKFGIRLDVLGASRNEEQKMADEDKDNGSDSAHNTPLTQEANRTDNERK
jgi:hypothetical protein